MVCQPILEHASSRDGRGASMAGWTQANVWHTLCSANLGAERWSVPTSASVCPQYGQEPSAWAAAVILVLQWESVLWH